MWGLIDRATACTLQDAEGAQIREWVLEDMQMRGDTLLLGPALLPCGVEIPAGSKLSFHEQSQLFCIYSYEA